MTTKHGHKPADRDEYICQHCGKKNRHRSPYMYATRHIDSKKRIQIIDSWNIPYSTGIYLLAHDDVTKEEIEEFARDKVHFPFWTPVREGVLWSKNTWDD